MVLWGLKMKNPDDAEERRASLSRAIQLSQEAAKYCEAHFAKPNTLNFENLYFPFLLITKKRYGGQMWQTADAPVPKLKIQGLESKRRDNCKLVSRTQEKCLEMILRERRPDDALAFTQRQIQALLTGRVDMHDLIITKQLRCYQKDYKSPQPHAHVRELMEKRSPGSGAKIGDRVPYVFIRRERKEVMYLSAEDPLYAVEHDLPINTNYYLQNQFFKPMVRIFTPVYGEAEAVTLVQHGEHTRHLDFHVTLHSDQGLGRYFTKRIMCRGCKVTLTESNVSPHAKVEHRLCSSCEPRRIEYYTTDMEDLRTTERESGLCWANCQNCQGSRFQAVICSAQDCPVFYKRLVLRRDVVVKGKQLALLGLEDS
jgi:DNA polymerase delta subunit 1